MSEIDSLNNYNNLSSQFVVNTDIVRLPSKGIFYENIKEEVTVEYMTTQDENILTTPNLLKSGRVFDELIKRKVKDKDINIDKLLVGDKNAILMFLRITAYGADYPVKVTDPETLEQFDANVELDKIGIKELTVYPDDKLEYSFTLPLAKKKIKFRLLNAKEDDEIIKKSESESKMNGGILPLMTNRLKAQIMEIEGVRDKIIISKIIDTMSPIDSKKLRKYIDEVTPDLDLTYLFVNPITGNQFRDAVQITPRFFYPESRI